MPQTKFTFLLVIFSCMVCRVFAQANVEPDGKAIAHLKKFRLDYVKSTLEKKPEMIQGYSAETIRLMPAFQRTVIGKANALSYRKAFSARFDINSYTRKEIEILNLGSMIVELGMFDMKATLKSSGKEYELKGKYQNIWEQSKNGELVLITEAWNYNNQLEIEEQFRFKEVPTVDIALQPHLAINSKISFELAALNRLLEITISQHDAKIWSQFYADDAAIYSNRKSINEGRKAIDEYFEKDVKELPIFEKLDIRNDRIDDLGNYVIEYASHIAIWRGGEYSGIGLGKDLRIWRRESDCSLKIFRHIGMYD